MRDQETVRNPQRPSLLAAGLLVAGAGQAIVVVCPERLRLPEGLESALRPMWPDAAAAGAAVAFFLVATVLAALSAREAAPPGAWHAIAMEPAARRRPPRAALAPALAGLALLGWVLVRAWSGTADVRVGGSYLLALALFGAALALLDGPSAAREAGPRVSVSGVLETTYVLAMVGMFWVFATRDAASWYYASIGDEYAFYDAAAAFARGEVSGGVFSQQGAYGIIPVLSSLWQGLLMRVVGTDAVSWKIVTVAPLPVTLALLYLLARVLYGRLTAVLALGMLASSHYLLAYAHTGYPNLEPLCPTVAAMLLLVVGLRRGSRLLLAGAGAFAGLGWYTYYTSRVAIVVIAAAIPLLVRRADVRRSWGRVASGFLVLVAPLFAASRSEVLARMLEQAGSGPTAEYASNRAMLPLWNAGRSLLAFNYNRHSGPYLLGSLAEPVTAVLFVAGLGWLLGAWRDRRSRLLVAWYTIGVTAVGVFSKYDYVSVSRLNFLLPVVALCAAVAARQAVAALATSAASRVVRALAVSCLLAAVTTFNLDRFLVEAPARVESSADAVVFRIVTDPRCQVAARPPLVVDRGIGGALPPALRARGVRSFPEWALYGTGTGWIEGADSRCVVFRVPRDPEAVELRAELLRRRPGLRTLRETDLTGHVGVLVSYPSGPRAAGSR